MVRYCRPRGMKNIWLNRGVWWWSDFILKKKGLSQSDLTTHRVNNNSLSFAHVDQRIKMCNLWLCLNTENQRT